MCHGCLGTDLGEFSTADSKSKATGGVGDICVTNLVRSACCWSCSCTLRQTSPAVSQTLPTLVKRAAILSLRRNPAARLFSRWPRQASTAAAGTAGSWVNTDKGRRATRGKYTQSGGEEITAQFWIEGISKKDGDWHNYHIKWNKAWKACGQHNQTRQMAETIAFLSAEHCYSLF